MTDSNREYLDEINVAAYYISQDNKPYDVLCWFLAERLLIYENKGIPPPEYIIKQKAAQIYFEKCPYDILCFRIAELDILMKYNRFDIDYLQSNKC
ncbi:MAG: hypothetical protein ACFFBP_10595 [Promethearchaeota archaeon]